MFLERHTDLTIHSHEISPATIGGVLSRFGGEYDREQGLIDRKLLSQTPLGSVLLNHLGDYFQPEVVPSECPDYKLVLLASLLVGKTNPADIERLSDILCGRLVKKEDTIGEFGALSGRRGIDCKPLSQCWKTTIELARLLRFMREVEEVPIMDNSMENEEELRAVLNKRSQIKGNNKRRQMVFLTWNETRLVVSSLFDAETEGTMLPETDGQVEVNERALQVIKPKAFDASAQLNVGGPEYQKLTDWVEETVLTPLMDVVGERNLAICLGGDIYLSAQRTAENCPKKPEEQFFGARS